MTEPRLSELFYVAKERQLVHVRKESGQRKPWTTDSILQRFRFANVYREQDKTTRWIAQNWREPHRKDKDVWFAMVVSRQFNLPKTLEAMGYPIPWDANKVVTLLRERNAAGTPIFNSAYKVIGGMPGKMPTLDFVVNYVINPMWENRKRIQEAIQASSSSLSLVHTALQEFRGMGKFMAAQIIAELKYTDLLCRAADWYTWAAPGPGSMRGLNRVLHKDFNSGWKDSVWHSELMKIYPAAYSFAEDNGMPGLQAQDFQGWLCEFDKYERVRLGEGSLRSYPGT